MSDIIKWKPEEVELIKSMYFKGSTDEEFKMFLYLSQRTGLNPMARQIFPVKRRDWKTQRDVMTVQTGIDGYRLIAERTGRYAPGREPTYTYDTNGNIISATSYVKKQTDDGTWHEVAATAYYNEYVQKTKDGTPTKFWKQMSHNQLAKCAEALCLRKCFPYELSGIYTQEEMQQADISNDKPPEEKITSIEIEEICEGLPNPEDQQELLDRLERAFGYTCFEDISKTQMNGIRQFIKQKKGG